MNRYFVPTCAEEPGGALEAGAGDILTGGGGGSLPARDPTTFCQRRLIAADGGWYGEILAT